MKNKQNQAKILLAKTNAELKSLLRKAYSDLVKLKMELKIDKLKNTSAIKKKRQKIARIKTIIRKKELAEIK